MLSVRAYQPVFVCTSSGRVCRQHRDGVFAGRNGSAAGPEDYYSAQQEIRLMGYSFTSPEVAGALVRANSVVSM
jgi:hypothetical protein